MCEAETVVDQSSATLPAIAENSVARISIKIYLCRRIRNVSCFQKKNMSCIINLIYVIEVFFTEFRLIVVF